MTTPVRPLLREQGLTLYPVAALGLLGIVDTFQSYAFTVLTPEISRGLGLSLVAVAGARSLAFLATIVAPLPVAALSQLGRGHRVALCLATAVVWSLVTLLTGSVGGLLALIAVLVVDGLSTGSVSALHAPLLVDTYPREARVRVLSSYQGVVAAGQVLSPLLLALLAGPAGLTWRGVFLVLGGTSLVSTLGAVGLRDPGPRDVRAPSVELGFFEICRRLLLIPTVQRIAVGYFAVGILIIPFATFLSSFLEQRWGLIASERGLFFAGISAVSVAALLLYGRRAERSFADRPARLLDLSAQALALAVTCIAIGALSPSFPLMCLLFAAGQSLVALLTPGLTTCLLSVVEPRQRPHAAAVVGLFTASGSLLGVLLLAGVDRRYGTTGTIVSLLVPGVVGALLLRSARTLLPADLTRLAATEAAAVEVEQARASGRSIPLLACSGLQFSYGPLDVLFDVDLTVDQGEMLALLGTNGAGKSTLLKAISGIGLPRGGTIRLDGQDITYLDAERRVPLGIAQVPGGRAVFGDLGVIDNLRLYGWTLGRDRRTVEEGIERCLDAFPRLADRRGTQAGLLSGGEQQMLGLSKALLLQPRLLLVDELSLGLAPLVVEQLLAMVRRINAAGTAVVLVEQSVTTALSLVDRACFMERGRIRYDGPAADLLDRQDLLRAVFLPEPAR